MASGDMKAFMEGARMLYSSRDPVFSASALIEMTESIIARIMGAAVVAFPGMVMEFGVVMGG
jgi:hypothetical protein